MSKREVREHVTVLVTYELDVPVGEIIDPDDDLSNDEFRERVKHAVQDYPDLLRHAIDLPTVEVDDHDRRIGAELGRIAEGGSE